MILKIETNRRSESMVEYWYKMSCRPMFTMSLAWQLSVGDKCAPHYAGGHDEPLKRLHVSWPYPTSIVSLHVDSKRPILLVGPLSGLHSCRCLDQSSGCSQCLRRTIPGGDSTVTHSQTLRLRFVNMPRKPNDLPLRHISTVRRFNSKQHAAPQQESLVNLLVHGSTAEGNDDDPRAPPQWSCLQGLTRMLPHHLRRPSIDF